ncbi:MAG: DUF2514 family protein [Roseateles sp.]|uniref:DUF2514 family protein n=1 Tax=Roseateles sp. TaxID=1971397 RepID=UPI0040365D3E
MITALAILRRVPVLGWVVLALGLLLGAQTLRLSASQADVARAKAETSKVRAEFGAYRETQERNARQALESFARDAALTAKKRQEAADAEHLARQAAEADAARLRRTAGQLQRYSADLATSLGDRARDTATASSCETADARIVRLSLVVGALDDFAAEAAGAADSAIRAGQLCVASYDALTP